MGGLVGFLKLVAGIVSMVIMLASVLSILYGLFLLIAEDHEYLTGAILIVGGIMAGFIATIMGKFSKGDYE